MNYKRAIAALMIGSSLSVASFSVSAKSQNDGAPKAAVRQTQVNINRASAKMLSADLDGVGPVKAEAIVRYRKAHGDFTRVQDLAQVSGIGEKTVTENRSHIRLK